MFWPVAELAEALTYCEDNTEPMKVWADAVELEKNLAAQAY